MNHGKQSWKLGLILSNPAIAPSATVSAAIESNSAQSYLSFITPTTGVSGLQFGDSGDVDKAHFRYSQNSDVFEWMFNSGTIQLAQLDGATGDWNITGNIDLNDNTLIDVGAAGNDWTAASLTHRRSTTGNQTIFLNNESNGATGDHARLYVTTGGASGGDPYIALGVAGSAGAIVMSLGLDNSVSNNFTISNGTVLGTNDRLRLDNTTGVLSIDGAGAGDGLPTLFDNYNDAEELRGFQLANVSLDIASANEQLANQQRLVDIGVAEWAVQEDGSNHWMIRVQSMQRLLAGGVWQSQQQIDENKELIELILSKVTQLENEICELKEAC